METIILDIKTVDGEIIPTEFDLASLLNHHERVLEGLSMLRAAPHLQVV